MGIEDKVKDKSTKDSPKSRRIFLKGVLGVGVAAAVANLAYTIFDDRIDEPEKRFEKAMSFKSTNPVASYSEDIIIQAVRLLRESYTGYTTELLGGSSVVGFIAGTVPTWKIIRGKYSKEVSRRIFLGTGLASLINRVVDKYSTYRVASLTRYERFKEYGISKYIIEGGISLSMHPTPKDLFKPTKLLFDASMVTTGTFIIPIGFALGASTPFIYLNNKHIGDIIELSFKIGDNVKVKIEQGYNSTQVKEYIKGLSLNDLQSQKS